MQRLSELDPGAGSQHRAGAWMKSPRRVERPGRAQDVLGVDGRRGHDPAADEGLAVRAPDDALDDASPVEKRNVEESVSTPAAPVGAALPAAGASRLIAISAAPAGPWNEVSAFERLVVYPLLEFFSAPTTKICAEWKGFCRIAE